MKKITFLPALMLFLFCGASVCLQAQVTDPKQTAGQSASDHVNNNVSGGINNSLDKTEGAIKGLFKKKNKPAKSDSSKTAAAGNSANGTPAGSANGSGAAATGNSTNGATPSAGDQDPGGP